MRMHRPVGRERPLGWPLTLLFAGYPLWWILGITLPMTMLVTGMLIAELRRMPHLRLPRFGTLWGLFLAWALIGVLVVQVDAPYAVAGWNTNRYLTWALRLFWYVAATVALLYLGNVVDRATRTRIFATFGWMFVWVVIGGYLGAVAPRIGFPSAIEVMLPHSLSSNAFVASLVHPNLAEQMEFAGVTRPSAPFPFANVWGLNFACFLPFFVVGWRGSLGWKRRVAPLVLAASVFPAIASLNRGLWVALGVAGLVLVIRAVMAGNVRIVIVLGIGGAILGMVIALSPLGVMVADRLSSPNSNQGRSALASRGFASTNASPIVGFGTTRNVQGSLTSIAGGSTPSCPRCGAPSFGTQGQIFLTTFAQGYVGAAFYLGFLLLVLVRSFRRPGSTVTMALCVLAMHGATMSVYSADNLAVIPIFAAAGVLWRVADESWQGVPLLLARARTRPRWMIATTMCGGLVGLAAFVVAPHQVQVSTPVLVSAGDQSAPTSLDTIAQFATGAPVIDAVAHAVHRDPASVDAHLSVTADPNTRVLALTYSAADLKDARAGSLASAHGLLALWQGLLERDQHGRQQVLVGQLGGIEQALRVTGAGREALQAGIGGPVDRSAGRQLAELQTRLVSTWAAADAVLRGVIANAPSSGQVVGVPTRLTSSLPWAKSLGAGLALGLLVSLTPALPRRSSPGRSFRLSWGRLSWGRVRPASLRHREKEEVSS